MSVPYIPHSSSSIYSDDQESLSRGYNNGTPYGGFGTDAELYSVIVSLTARKNIIPKIFYQKVSPTATRINVVVVNNVREPDHEIFNIRATKSQNPFDPTTYYLDMRDITSSFTTSLGNTIYYSLINGVDIDTINPQIPIFETLEEGLNTSDIEGWLYRDPDNPYEFDDESISYAGGGTGSFDNSSDTVGVPALPTLSAVSAGFISMYSPSLSQLNQLASFLWTDSMFDPDNFKKLFTDPMECIIGLTIVPVNPTTSGSMNVKVGYVDTGISMPRLSSQYAEVSCGSIQAQEFWGSALDYSPMTRIHLYLPYVGIREISADEVMNKSIGVTYHIDLLSGALTAFVTANGSVLYQFNGQCALNIPMASSNFTNMIQGAITSIGSVASTVATSGASVGAGMALTATQIGASTANNAISNKPSFSHSGSMGGSGGMLGVQTPYLIIERPRQSMPEGMNKFCGFPSNIYYKLSDLEGYTQIEYIHLDNVPATGAELDEIEGLLRTGVIL